MHATAAVAPTTAAAAPTAAAEPTTAAGAHDTTAAPPSPPQSAPLPPAPPPRHNQPARRRDYHDADFPHEELAGAGAAFAARYAGVDRAADAAALADGAAAAWQRFHRRNATGRFFKPRHYVVEAFPCLRALPPGAAVLEVGAGNGSNATLLEDAPQVRLIVTDVATAALEACAAHPAVVAHADRVRLFCWDLVTGGVPAGLAAAAAAAGGEGGGGSAPGSSHAARVAAWAAGPPPPELRGGMDACLLMFVLSALHPRDHAAALAAARATLRPGGVLCFRDYGLHDLAQLRAGPGAVLSQRLHARPDGTLAYYFETAELAAALEAAGFAVAEARYATVRNVNRGRGVTMSRVWVHARAVAV